MRGSAIGLSLLIGVELEERLLVWLLLMLLFMITLGSADPSSFVVTWYSPNILVVTELLRRPRILGKLFDDDEIEEEDAVEVVVVTMDAGAAGVEGVLEFVLFEIP